MFFNKHTRQTNVHEHYTRFRINVRTIKKNPNDPSDCANVTRTTEHTRRNDLVGSVVVIYLEVIVVRYGLVVPEVRSQKRGLRVYHVGPQQFGFGFFFFVRIAAVSRHCARFTCENETPPAR